MSSHLNERLFGKECESPYRYPMVSIRSRLKHWRAVLSLGWKYFIAAPFAILSVATWARDEFFSPETYGRYKLYLLEQKLPWHWWFISTLFIIIALILEGSYRNSHEKEREMPAMNAEKTDAPEDRVSLFGFVKIASQDGWQIPSDTSLDALDLMQGIRQAARDSLISLYGIPDRFKNRSVLGRETINPIPSQYWEIADIPYYHWDNNMDTQTSTPLNPEGMRYVNLFLPRPSALRWLKSRAKTFRGYTVSMNEARRRGH